MLTAAWEAFCSIVAWIFRKPKERIEPVIEGFVGLVGGQEGFIETLKATIDSLNKSIIALNQELAEGRKSRIRLGKRLGEATGGIKKLTKEVEECNEHRQQLEDRVKTLETKAPEPPSPQI